VVVCDDLMDFWRFLGRLVDFLVMVDLFMDFLVMMSFLVMMNDILSFMAVFLSTIFSILDNASFDRG